MTKLPCDIHLPPNTILREGVGLATLMLALQRRGMVQEESFGSEIDLNLLAAKQNRIIVDQAARIAALEAELRKRLDIIVEQDGDNAKLKSCLSTAEDALKIANSRVELHKTLCAGAQERADLFEARLSTAEADLAAAVEALKPFAVDDAAWETQPDDLEIELRAFDGQPQPCILLADLRRARSIVANTGRTE